MKEKKRQTGIDVVGAVPYGMHLCLFYVAKQDLLDILVPFFKAGLENNELCVWITSEPLSEEEVKAAMRKAIPDSAQYLESGQIGFVPYTDFYFKDGVLTLQKVQDVLGESINQAQANGYDGLRVTGNTAWVEEENWREFTEYEEEINKVIGEYQVLSICTYSLDKCGVSEIVDVVQNHQNVLIRRYGSWTFTGSAEYIRLQHDLTERRKEIECIYGVTNITGMLDKPLDEVYQEVVNLLPKGWQYPEIACAKVTIGGKEFRTENCRETERKQSQSSDIKVHGVKTGVVEVAYCKERPEIDEGPFLKEERLLIDAVAGHLGKVIERKWGFIESSGRKQAKEALRESEEKFLISMDTMLDGFAIFSAIRNEAGRIVDFRYEYINEAGCQLNQRSCEEQIGHTLLELLPAHKDTGLFDEYMRVVETGQLLAKESLLYEDVFGGGRKLNRAFDFQAVKLGDGFAVDWRDITERKQVEENRRRLTLLQGRFLKSGFEGFDEQGIVELFLSLALSHPECQKLAKKCLAKFKDFSGFLAASPQELEQIGIAPRCMFYIKLLHELPIEILRKKIIEQPFYQSSQEIFDYLYYSMRDLQKEIFKAIYLNSRNQIIDAEDLFEGTLESIPIRPREIVESAIKHGSAGVIFVHNHPSGNTTPSKGDKQLTRDLVFIGNIIEVKVLDHIIIGGNSYFSFADEGLITKYEDSFLNLRIRGVFDSGAVIGDI